MPRVNAAGGTIPQRYDPHTTKLHKDWLLDQGKAFDTLVATAASHSYLATILLHRHASKLARRTSRSICATVHTLISLQPATQQSRPGSGLVVCRTNPKRSVLKELRTVLCSNVLLKFQMGARKTVRKLQISLRYYMHTELY